MKYFLIKYRLQNVAPEAWHKEVAEFIAALDGDPALKGKISYRCMKSRAGADWYYHRLYENLIDRVRSTAIAYLPRESPTWRMAYQIYRMLAASPH